MSWLNEWNTPVWVRGESCQHQKSSSLIFPPWSLFLNLLNKYCNYSGFQGHQLSLCLNTCVLKSLQDKSWKNTNADPRDSVIVNFKFSPFKNRELCWGFLINFQPLTEKHCLTEGASCNNPSFWILLPFSCILSIFSLAASGLNKDWPAPLLYFFL